MCQQALEIPPVPSSMQEVIEIFGSETSKVPTPITDDVKAWVGEIKEIDAEKKALDARRNHLRDKIASVMLNSPVIVNDDGVEVVTWKTVEKYTVNQKRLAELYPDAYSDSLDYRPYRQFIVK